MKKNAGGFTLVELLITIGMMIIMTGTLSRVWITMEKVAKASQRNTFFTHVSQKIFEQIRRDLSQSSSVARSEGSLLILSQRIEDGSERKIHYRYEEEELLRDILLPGGETQSIKVAGMKEMVLNISFLKEGRIRLEIIRKSKRRPLDAKPKRLITYITLRGTKQ